MIRKVELASIAITAIIVSWMFHGTHAVASVESDKVEIIDVIQKTNEMMEKKDLEAWMAYYLDAQDTVFFEDTPPLRIDGKAAFRKFDEEFLRSASNIHFRMETPIVAISGDLGVIICTAQSSWTDKDGSHNERARFTGVLKKVNGKWLVWHEHLSVPYDSATGKAVLDAK